MNLEEKRHYFKEEFYKIATRILAEYPSELELFQKYWNEQYYREACAFYYAEMPPKKRNVLTSEEKKIEIEFFGLFVN